MKKIIIKSPCRSIESFIENKNYTDLLQKIDEWHGFSSKEENEDGHTYFFEKDAQLSVYKTLVSFYHFR